MLPFVLEVAVAVLAGPLLIAGSAKLFTLPEKLSWPYDSGPLRIPHGPRIVGAGECVTAIALVLLPNPMAAAVAFMAYGVLAGTAYRLRGTKCACFGAARLAAVGRAHVGGNLLGTSVAAALVAGSLLAEPAWSPLSRTVAAIAAALVVLAVVVALDRRRAGTEAATPRCTERVSGVQLYVSTTCPACRSLEHLVTTMEPARRAAIDQVVVGSGDEVPEAIRDLGVPAATALDAAGSPICTPVAGIGAVKALIDSITIGSRAGASAR